MDAEILSRIQFAVTAGFHYLYPPISIGLGLMLVIMEVSWLRTGKQIYNDMARFWTRIFGLTFAIGVATGIVLEFEFGTNWATYSRFVGDVFGSALAAEGIFAFFLESGFLAILLFGWDRVSKGWHFFATLMVCLGAHFSAIWIVVANSWMQTPAGYHLVWRDTGKPIAEQVPDITLATAEQLQNIRAEIVDFWALVFNPSSMERLSHVLMGAWQAGAFLVISVSAFYLIRNRHTEMAIRSLRMGLGFAVAASLLSLVTGHMSAVGVAENQPAKLAAMEGHWEENAPADLHLIGWVDVKNEKTVGLSLPGMVSWLTYFDAEKPMKGLKAFAKDDRPVIALTFITFHLMIVFGMMLILITLIGVFLAWRGKLAQTKWFLWVLVFSIVLPMVTNQIGWITAEVGRQPWIVYGMLRTSDGLSKSVSGEAVMASLIMFTLIYLLFFFLWLYLLNEKIKQGPAESDQSDAAYSKIRGALPHRESEEKSVASAPGPSAS